jgi:hypothetical protein
MLGLVGRGPSGAALAYAISCMLIMPIEVALVRGALSLTVSAYAISLLPAVVCTALSSAALVGVMYLLSPMLPIAQLILGGLFAAAFYSVMVRFLAPAAFRRYIEITRFAFGRSRTRTAEPALDTVDDPAAEARRQSPR